MVDVYIIGTDHPYQTGDARIPISALQEFRNMLKEKCVQYGIRAIGEEMSLEGLGNQRQQGSICKQVAEQLRSENDSCKKGP